MPGIALADAGRRRGRLGRGGDRRSGQLQAWQEIGRRSAGQRAARVCKSRSLPPPGTVPGVEEVTRLRLRRSGPEIFADVTLAVGRGAAFERRTTSPTTSRPPSTPCCPKPTSWSTSSRRSQRGGRDHGRPPAGRAARSGAHGIRIYEENRQRWLELHLEVSESLLLDEAHRQATEFEQELRQSLPGVTRIVTHIEPVGDSAATIRGEPAGQREVQKAIADFLAGLSAAGQAARLAGATGRRGIGRLVPLHARRLDGHHRCPSAHRPIGRVSPRPSPASAAWRFTSNRIRRNRDNGSGR